MLDTIVIVLPILTFLLGSSKLLWLSWCRFFNPPIVEVKMEDLRVYNRLRHLKADAYFLVEVSITNVARPTGRTAKIDFDSSFFLVICDEASHEYPLSKMAGALHCGTVVLPARTSSWNMMLFEGMSPCCWKSGELLSGIYIVEAKSNLTLGGATQHVRSQDMHDLASTRLLNTRLNRQEKDNVQNHEDAETHMSPSNS